MSTAGCGCQFDAAGNVFVDHCVCVDGLADRDVDAANEAQFVLPKAVAGLVADAIMRPERYWRRPQDKQLTNEVMSLVEARREAQR